MKNSPTQSVATGFLSSEAERTASGTQACIAGFLGILRPSLTVDKKEMQEMQIWLLFSLL